MIAGELDKSSSLRRYFDGWGNRAYLWVSAIGRPFDVRFSRAPPESISPDFDIGALAAMCATHIYSAIPLSNWRDLELQPMGKARAQAPGELDLWVYGVPKLLAVARQDRSS